MIGSHGHVVPRPDGMKARCGGPELCAQCAIEAAQEAAASEVIGYKIGDRIYDPADVVIILRGREQQT
jgi:hypothetical protein